MEVFTGFIVIGTEDNENLIGPSGRSYNITNLF